MINNVRERNPMPEQPIEVRCDNFNEVALGYTKEELEELCPLGTPVGFKPIYADLLNDRLAGKAFDDKACGACAVFGIDAVQRRDLAGDVYFLFSAYEETGMTGARVAGFGIRPDYALVLDVTHASVPEAKDRYLPEFGSGVAVAASPITNRRLTAMTMDLCRTGNIPYTVETCPGNTGTNANVYNLIIAIIIAVIIVISMNFVGSLLVSALIIFPALSAMRVLKNFKAVTICSACLSVLCASLGFFVSLLLETPLGATMVAVNIVCFGVFSLIGAVKNK